MAKLSLLLGTPWTVSVFWAVMKTWLE